LGSDASRSLLHDLLRPVEYVAEPTLTRIQEMTRGVPLMLVELVHALRAGGAIRPLPGTETWQLVADDLLQASSTPLAARLAEKAVAGLPEQLVDFLQFC